MPMVQWYSPGGASVHSALIRASLGPPEFKYQTASRSVQTFLHSSRHSDPILYNGPPFSPSPPKLPLSMGMWTTSNTWFLGPIQVLNPNGF